MLFLSLKNGQGFENVPVRSWDEIHSEEASRKIRSKAGALPCLLGDTGSLGTGFFGFKVSAPATRLRDDSVPLLSYHQKYLPEP